MVGSIVERDALVGNLLDRLEALEARIGVLEATHPGMPGTEAGKLAYFDEDGYLIIETGGRIGIRDDNDVVYYIRAQTDGLAIQPASNPDTGDLMFRVLSSGGTNRFGVTHNDYSVVTDDLRVGEGLWVGATASDPDEDDVHIDGSINASTPLGAAARLNTTFSIGNAAWTAIEFDVVIYDTDDGAGGCWDSGNPSRFQPNYPGYYLVIGVAHHVPSTGGSYRGVSIEKNGDGYEIASAHVDAINAYRGISTAAVVYLNGSTDYVEINAYQDSGSAQNLFGAANGWYTYGACFRLA